MARALILVEGQTEETFVNEVLGPHLYQCGYTSVSARLVGNARQRDRRGGIRGWDSVRRDILKHLKGDTGCLITTMVDYYALPQTGGRAWPGRAAAGSLPSQQATQKGTTVQAAIFTAIAAEFGQLNAARFIPYVMMHEFEGLLFSECVRFSEGIGHPELTPQFQAIRDQFDSPEDINDSPISAPSKRVEALVPGYQKPLLGFDAVKAIGLDAIRSQCPHFREWLERLEAWPAVAP